MPIKAALEQSYKKTLMTCEVQENKPLGDCSSDRATIFVDMHVDVSILKYSIKSYNDHLHTYIQTNNKKTE